jgi:hypothetical protein
MQYFIHLGAYTICREQTLNGEKMLHGQTAVVSGVAAHDDPNIKGSIPLMNISFLSNKDTHLPGGASTEWAMDSGLALD